jgi:hypothetical protein
MMRRAVLAFLVGLGRTSTSVTTKHPSAMVSAQPAKQDCLQPNSLAWFMVHTLQYPSCSSCDAAYGSGSDTPRTDWRATSWLPRLFGRLTFLLVYSPMIHHHVHCSPVKRNVSKVPYFMRGMCSPTCTRNLVYACHQIDDRRELACMRRSLTSIATSPRLYGYPCEEVLIACPL